METRYKGAFEAFRMAIVKSTIVKEIVPISKIISGRAISQPQPQQEEKTERDDVVEKGNFTATAPAGGENGKG